jgi:hypothetical protein
MSNRTLAALALLALSGSAHAMSTDYGDLSCLSTPLQPLDTDVRGTQGFVAQGDVTYVLGGTVDLVLTIDGCEEIVSVQRNGVELREGFDPIEGSSSWYEVVSEVPVNGDTQVILRVYFPTLGQGATSDMAVGISPVGGTAYGEWHTEVVDVADVSATLPVTMTEAELSNDSVLATWDLFGDQDSWLLEDFRLYDVSYSKATMDVHPTGIDVAFEASLEQWCDARIGMEGTFHLETDLEGLLVVWDEEPELWWDMPFLCDVVASPYLIADSIWGALSGDPLLDYSNAEQSFAAMVEERVAEATGGDCGAVSCATLIEDVYTTEDAVVVEVDLPLKRFAVDIPYDPTRHDEPGNYGMALPSGERVLVNAGGTAEACVGRSEDLSSCETVTISPRGLFDWDQAPVPDEWTLSDTNIWVFHEERAAARDALTGLYRDDEDLPLGELPVASLLGRLEGGDLAAMREPCAVDVPDAGARLGLGPNDHASPNGGDLGSGSFRVVVALGGTTFEQDVIGAMPDCPTYSELPSVDDLAVELELAP